MTNNDTRKYYFAWKKGDVKIVHPKVKETKSHGQAKDKRVKDSI